MQRIRGNYKDLKLEFLDVEDLQHIETKAKALEFNDCLDYLCIDIEDIPAEDLIIAKKIWRKGRTHYINDAGEKLFASMKMRGGGAVAFEYLKALSPTFTAEISQTSKSGFIFNVVMPEDDKSEDAA